MTSLLAFWNNSLGWSQTLWVQLKLLQTSELQVVYQSSSKYVKPFGYCQISNLYLWCFNSSNCFEFRQKSLWVHFYHTGVCEEFQSQLVHCLNKWLLMHDDDTQNGLWRQVVIHHRRKKGCFHLLKLYNSNWVL